MKKSEPLSEKEKEIYRQLLVLGLDRISTLCGGARQFSFSFAWLDTPKHMKERMVLMFVKDFATWLRKLASSNDQDFHGFDADEFWQNYNEICKNHPAHIGPNRAYSQDFFDFREWFNTTLAAINEKQHL
jgi:hypothetical protein